MHDGVDALRLQHILEQVSTLDVALDELDSASRKPQVGSLSLGAGEPPCLGPCSAAELQAKHADTKHIDFVADAGVDVQPRV